ncbi:MAG: 6-bladed beta-propeller [Candidatus Saccharicenans sp.]|nr:6-bladed beta-propeller [Candidatus Saccharicenans sp.]
MKSNARMEWGKNIIGLLLPILLTLVPLETMSQPVPSQEVKEVRLNGTQHRPFFFKPFALLLSSVGLMVSETGDNCLKLVGPDGRLKMTIGNQGQGPEEFDAPMGFDIHDQKLYVADSFNRRIKILSPEGKLLSSFRVDLIPVHLVVINPERIVVSGRPNPFQSQESLLHCYDSRGTLKWKALNPIPSSDSVYFTLINEIFLQKDAQGNIFVLHKYKTPQILKIKSEGKIAEEIKLDPAYPLKRIMLPLKIGKKPIDVVFWNMAWDGDKFYLLIPELDGQGDLGPGKEVYVISRQGKILEKIIFPQAIRLLATDGTTFYILNAEDELFIYREGS